MTILELKQRVDFILENKIVSPDENVLFFSNGQGQIKRCTGFVEGINAPALVLDAGGIFDYIQLGFGHLEH